MQDNDTLELAAQGGLPWIDLSVMRSEVIHSAPGSVEVELGSLRIKLIATRDEMQFLQHHERRVFTDQALLDRHTEQRDDMPTIDLPETQTESEELNQAPLVRMTRHLLLDAIAQGVSDIHITPERERVSIKFRVDGFLVEQPATPQHLEKRVLARIKVMANLDLTESGRAQDGAIEVIDLNGDTRRFRVAILPALHGEKAVLRLVGHVDDLPPLHGLGMTETQFESMQGLLHQTQGLILVTGPTGSGKSMTLARCLLDLARDDRHVATVEDPIEFELPGVHQVQLNRARALDFPTSLRALLRQDPDVIMIGEIRDQETAHIAIQAAETGHLVLATVHTKRAQDAEKRLAHFGIAPTHLNTVLKRVIAQRLIRTLCEICHGQGCGECQGGYRGRTGLFEMFSPNQTTHPAEEDYRDSIAHHLAHHRTTPEEIHRVLGFEIVSHTLD
jgi:type II secretory ATPase GspE/PulE/Tfp pilus assembly ATPase PilB-like protein